MDEAVGTEVIEEARQGRWSVLLTEQKPVPREWFPAEMRGLKVLCLASGGGQLDAGFQLTGLYEDRPRGLRVAEFMPTYVATRAVKP